MGRYFFILDDGRRIDDDVGTVLADSQVAREHARRIIAELSADPSFADYAGEMIVMREETEVFRIPFRSA